MSPLIKHLLTINKKSDILDYKRQLKSKESDFFDFFKKIMIFINPEIYCLSICVCPRRLYKYPLKSLWDNFEISINVFTLY